MRLGFNNFGQHKVSGVYCVLWGLSLRLYQGQEYLTSQYTPPLVVRFVRCGLHINVTPFPNLPFPLR